MRFCLALAVLLSTTAVSAAEISCTLPASIEPIHAEDPGGRNEQRVLPIASYTLALSWSPQFCRGQGGKASFQCTSGNRFGMTLHGLWPDGAGTTWPQYCKPVDLLSEAQLRKNLCVTPSAQLNQHEWAKHGSCMGVTPRQYFDQSHVLYQALTMPDFDRLSRNRNLTVGDFKDAFARANRGRVPVNAIRVTVTGGRWLDELWLCLDTRYKFTRCKPAQDGGVPNSRRLQIWRGSAG
jgi:ribonuclease T2